MNVFSDFKMAILEHRFFELGLTLFFLIFFLTVRAIVRKIIALHTKKFDLDLSRKKYANKFFNFVWSLLFLVVLGIIWDVSVRGLSIYFASFFTVAGVALFATWSMLSNITASVILFFNFPFKIGSKITIMDKDDSVTGTVQDITFFSIQVLTAEGHLVSYPNNMAIQKAIKQINESNEIT